MRRRKQAGDFYPLYPPDPSPYRIRLPGSIVQALEWPTSLDQLDCVAAFRHRGEMVCALRAAALPDGSHPMQSALDYMRRTRTTRIPLGVRDIPPTSSVALDLVVFEFTATWEGASRDQLDLPLSTTRTSLFGWRRGVPCPPIYPRAWPGLLLLMSQERVFRLHDEEGAVLTED